jgi:hypothetical protein
VKILAKTKQGRALGRQKEERAAKKCPLLYGSIE